MGSRPTLNEVRAWPATVGVGRAADALGVGRSTAYSAIRAGKFPARTVQVGDRVMVLTASLLEVLGVPADGAAA